MSGASRRSRNRAVLATTALAAICASAGLPITPASGRDATATVVRAVRGLAYRVVDGQTLRLDAYLPTATGPMRPAVVIVHGGGWRSGTRATFAPGEASVKPTASLFAAQGWATFSIDYRLAPAALFPAQLSDVQAALTWIRRQHVRYHIDPRRVALLGASAGGNVAVLAALTAQPGTAPTAVVSWSGPMELASFYTALATSSSRPFVADYLGCVPATCPGRYQDASPLNHITASSPPTLLANGTREIVPLQQARDMAAALKAKHVPHSLIILPGSRHAAEYEAAVIDPTISFLASRLDHR